MEVPVLPLLITPATSESLSSPIVLALSAGATPVVPCRLAPWQAAHFEAYRAAASIAGVDVMAGEVVVTTLLELPPEQATALSARTRTRIEARITLDKITPPST